jgi:hypothetical protein
VEPPSLQFCPGVMLYAEIGCDWAVILVSDGVSLPLTAAAVIGNPLPSRIQSATCSIDASIRHGPVAHPSHPVSTASEDDFAEAASMSRAPVTFLLFLSVPKQGRGE